MLRRLFGILVVLMIALGLLGIFFAIAAPAVARFLPPARIVERNVGVPYGVNTYPNEIVRHSANAWMDGLARSDAAILGLVAILCGTLIILIFLKLFFSAARRHEKKRTLPVEEDEMLQRLWEMGQKMEERILNLESILMHERR